jgi:type IV pilus assembly protein PilB
MESLPSSLSLDLVYIKLHICQVLFLSLHLYPYPLRLPEKPYILEGMTITFDDAVQNHRLEDMHKEEEEELVKILSDKYGLPYIDLHGIAPEPDAMQLVKEEDAREAYCAPFKIVGRKLHIATVSPSNEKLEEIIRPLETRGMEIILYLASHASVEHVLLRYADLNKSSKVESGMLELTPEKMMTLMASFNSIDELRYQFDTLLSSQALYKTTRTIELIIAGALKFDASDIHIEPEEEKVRLRYRLNGVLDDVAFFDFNALKTITSRLKLLAGLKLSTVANAQDGRFSIDLGEVEVEVRVSVVPGNYGESFVMRLLDPRHNVNDLDSIAFPQVLRDKIEYALGRPNGVILTTGPTGSGKTTTLYAFLHKVYSSEIKVITIEDPIEYHLEGIIQTQVEEEKGYTFLSGLRAALRQDPDILMVGEIRDEDTAKVAVNAALTGHLVFSTLHTNNAAGTIPRLVELGVNPKTLASALSIALAQRLVRTLCNECKEAYESNEKESRAITSILGAMKVNGKESSMLGHEPSLSYALHKPVGCAACGGTGFASRIGIFEALIMDEAIEKILVQNPSEREIREASAHQGIPSLREDGIIKVLEGITSFDELGKAVDLYGEN